MGFFTQFFVALVFGVKRHWHILFAIFFGFALGFVFHAYKLGDTTNMYVLVEFFEFIGDLFIRLIRMLVIPLVVSSLIVGLSSLKDVRQLGRMGGKVLGLFTFLMLLSALLGVLIASLVQPGALVQDTIREMEASGITTHTQQLQNEDLQSPIEASSLKERFLDMIPQNPVQALSSDNLVPAIVFTLMFGFAIAFIGQAGKPLVSFFESMFTATMKLTDWVMILAVPGIFALTFSAAQESGVDIIKQIFPFAATIIIGLLIQILIIFPVMLQMLAKVNFANLYRAISEAILVAFGTASSSATLPITIANCELRAGISNRIASFVLPTGASGNKTATTMFEVVAVMFLAQAYGITLDPPTIVLIVIFAIIASVGAAAVPSAGMITMGIVIVSIGDQFSLSAFTVGISLLWSIDRLLDMCRTVVNVVSSCTVATIIASSEGELKRDILNNPESWKETV